MELIDWSAWKMTKSRQHTVRSLQVWLTMKSLARKLAKFFLCFPSGTHLLSSGHDRIAASSILLGNYWSND